MVDFLIYCMSSKVRTFWEALKIWKNLPHAFDKSADWLNKRQNHEEDFFKICVLLRKFELYLKVLSRLIKNERFFSSACINWVMFPGAHRYDASTSDSLDWVESIFWSQKDSHQSLGLDCHDHGGFRSRNFQNQLDMKCDSVAKFNAICWKFCT